MKLHEQSFVCRPSVGLEDINIELTCIHVSRQKSTCGSRMHKVPWLQGKCEACGMTAAVLVTACLLHTETIRQIRQVVQSNLQATDQASLKSRKRAKLTIKATYRQMAFSYLTDAQPHPDVHSSPSWGPECQEPHLP